MDSIEKDVLFEYKNLNYLQCLEISRYAWRYYRKVDITLFFSLRFLFIWANVSCFTWFKTKTCFVFCHQLLMNLLSVSDKETKTPDFDMIFFNFKMFHTFRNLEADSSITLKKHFWTVINTFFVTLFQISTHYKTSSKRAAAMPLHKTYFLACIYSYIKFYSPQMRRSWVKWT